MLEWYSTTPTAFTNIINDTTTPTPNTRAGNELKYIRSIGQQLQTFAAPVKSAAGKGKTLSGQWPSGGKNSLADQLRIVAQLIAGGLKTKIYVVNLGGFDSHDKQREGQDPLLLKLSTAVSAFQNELKLNALEDRVIGMTFSEFGRRVKSNDSLGTDHGAAAPLFVFGSKVIPGILGDNPVLPAKATFEDNVAIQFDFRQIYASVLKEWFDTPEAEITKTLLKSYSTLPIIQQQSVVETKAQPSTTELLQNYPNPVNEATNIAIRIPAGNAVLRVFDVNGRLVRTLLDGPVTSGEQIFSCDTRGLANGTYFYRLEFDGTSLTKEMVVMR